MPGPYTLHQEITDGSLCQAYHTVSTKRRAIQYAKAHAKDTKGRETDIINFVVCDADEMVIAVFPVS